jgi:phage tail protein X
MSGGFTSLTVLSPTAFGQEYGLLPAPGAPTVPPQPYVIYTTYPNDRWDLIAWRVYGDLTQIAALIAGNPQVPINCQLAQNTVIYAPVLTTPASPTVPSPWNP